MEVARKPTYRIEWNSNDVTKDVSAYISSIEFIDHEEGMSDECTIVVKNDDLRWLDDWFPSQGDFIKLAIGYGLDLFNCGLFEVDEVSASGTPHTMSIKCIASGFSTAMRTRNNHAFESQSLYAIADFFAKKYGMTIVDTSGLLSRINVERKTQEEKTDLSFLSEVAKEYGFIFNIRNNKMLFTSYNSLDEAVSVMDIYYDDISTYEFTVKMYDTYAASEFAAHDKKKKKTVKSKQKAVMQYAGEKPIQSVDVSKKTVSGSASEVNRKAYANLWNKNKFAQTCNITMEGTTELEASKNVNVCGFGKMSGKYHITSATHSMSDGAYTMSMDLRLTGTVPAPKAVPKAVNPAKKKKTSKKKVLEYAKTNEQEGW